MPCESRPSARSTQTSDNGSDEAACFFYCYYLFRRCNNHFFFIPCLDGQCRFLRTCCWQKRHPPSHSFRTVPQIFFLLNFRARNIRRKQAANEFNNYHDFFSSSLGCGSPTLMAAMRSHILLSCYTLVVGAFSTNDIRPVVVVVCSIQKEEILVVIFLFGPTDTSSGTSAVVVIVWHNRPDLL